MRMENSLKYVAEIYFPLDKIRIEFSKITLKTVVAVHPMPIPGNSINL